MSKEPCADRLTLHHYQQILLGAGVYLADGAEIIMLGAVSPLVASEFSMSYFAKGLIVALVYTGTLLANVVSGNLSDRFGRKPVLLWSYAGVVVSSLLSLLATGPLSLGFARFLCGFFFGTGGPAWNALAAEIAPTNRRTWVAALGLCLFSLGETFSAGVLLWGERGGGLSWRWLIALSASPAALLFCCSWLWLKESPMLQRGRQSQVKPTFAALVQGQFMYTTITLAFLAFTLNFGFYGALYGMPQELGSSPALSMIIAALIEVPGYLVAGIFGIRMRRKPLLLGFLLASIVSTVFIMTRGLALGLFLDIGLYGWKFFSSVGWLALYLYTSEVFNTEIRSFASGVVMAVGRVGAIIAPVSYELVMQGTGGALWMYAVIAIMLALGAVLVSFLPFETKGRVLDAN